MSLEDHPVWKGIAKFCAIVTALCTGAVVWMTQDGVQETVCGSRPIYGTGAADKLCDPQWQRVPQSDAEQTVDVFLGLAGGPGPADAWDMLSDEARDRRPKKDFVKAWGDVLWAERVGELKPGKAHNQWRLTYRTYGGVKNEDPKGAVRERVTLITLLQAPSGKEDQIAAIGRLSRTSNTDHVRAYPAIFADRGTRSYNLASTSSTLVDGDVEAEDMFRVMCQATVGGSTWFRTSFGWVDSSYLRNGGGAASGAPSCEPQHALVAAACNAQASQDPRCLGPATEE